MVSTPDLYSGVSCSDLGSRTGCNGLDIVHVFHQSV